MELNGRNPIYMTQFLPGVSSTATLGDFNFAFNSGDSFNINGARTQDTLYTIDGAPRGSHPRRRRDHRRRECRRGAGNASDHSRLLGGVWRCIRRPVRIVSKSGTTNFHGGAYEYLRNSAMNANTWSRNLNSQTHFPSPFVTTILDS